MVQSLTYKGPAGQPRTLTEEAGFSGGMMWTGNNIDPVHLKTIVNLDYDEVTGFLKTRPGVTQEALNIVDYPVTPVGSYWITPLHEIEQLDAIQLYLFIADITYDDPEAEPGDDTPKLTRQELVGIVVPPGTDEATVVYHETTTVNFREYYKDSFVFHDNAIYFTARTDDASYLYKVNLRALLGPPWYSFEYEHVAAESNSVSLLEATLMGYNALRGTDMYYYPSSLSVGIAPIINGVFLYEDASTTKVVASPKVGSTVYIVPSVAIDPTDTTYNYVVEAVNTAGSENDPAFVEIARKDITIGSTADVDSVAYTTKSEVFTLRVTLYQSTTVLDSVVCTYRCNRTTLPMKTYQITPAKNALVWNNRLVLYNIPNAANMLFMSEVDDFSYFPFPNNVHACDGDIYKCVPYLDSLLLFTSNKIYSLTQSEGVFQVKTIQDNIILDKDDSNCIIPIKNMVLYKSGTQFYMIVPKATSLTGELTVAPIYKNMAGWFNNTREAVLEVLQSTYPDLNIESIFVGPDISEVVATQDIVQIIYQVEVQCLKDLAAQTTRFNIFLNYNTNLRSWSLYVVHTSESYLTKIGYTTGRQLEYVSRGADGTVRSHTFDTTSGVDMVTNASIRTFIDTGYRTLNSNSKKRFREVQLRLYCESEDLITFGTSFYIDGETRNSCVELEEVIQGDGYTRSLTPVYNPNVFLGSDATDNPSDKIVLTKWKLGFSHLTKKAPVTVRIPVSGKGYAPRFTMVTQEPIQYELNGISWVYRQIFAR